MLDVFDTAGFMDFSMMHDQYLRAGDGFLFVYAVNVPSSLAELHNIRRRLLLVKDLDEGDALPVVLAANKVDLVNDRCVATEEGTELAHQWGCQHFETSALTRLNVETAFYEVVRQIWKQSGGPPAPESTKEHRHRSCALL
eukprot:TRINITY_DN2238_c0_g1_i1.p1 TRINITY_DN2238_c0_g1~~TRINITY_DN2238_c0_g1_i1.p1  ORF type:complete len:141 (+),score=37.72 TRINITY_DN2238_c0_g1_i1:265-687(+)